MSVHVWFVFFLIVIWFLFLGPLFSSSFTDHSALEIRMGILLVFSFYGSFQTGTKH